MVSSSAFHPKFKPGHDKARIYTIPKQEPGVVRIRPVIGCLTIDILCGGKNLEKTPDTHLPHSVGSLPGTGIAFLQHQPGKVSGRHTVATAGLSGGQPDLPVDLSRCPPGGFYCGSLAVVLQLWSGL